MIKRLHKILKNPSRLRIKLRNMLSVVKELDYSRYKILMEFDSNIEEKRLRACKKEPKTVKWIEDYMKQGEIFYDVGACVGSYSFVAWANGCKVYAFEPSFSNFASLCKNIYLNKADIIPLQVVVSDKTGLYPFRYSDISAGSALHNSNKTQFTQNISNYRLDDLIKQFELPIPNHIKIDTDGFELKVLKGAEKTLFKPEVHSILIEAIETHSDYSKIMNYLAKAKFSMKAKYSHQAVKEIAEYLFVRNKL